MKKKTAALLLALIMALGLFLSGCGGRAAQGESEAGSGSPEVESGGVFAGGSGTEDDPYVIATAADLNAVRSNLAACYRLDADILTCPAWSGRLSACSMERMMAFLWRRTPL